MELTDRRIVVTGGAGRIGRGLVNPSAAGGMKVVIADVSLRREGARKRVIG